jgi:hypothetical protein
MSEPRPLDKSACKDLREFTSRAKVLSSVYASVKREKNPGADKESQALIVTQEFRSAFNKAVDGDCHAFVSTLLGIDTGKRPPPPMIDDASLLERINDHGCDGKSDKSREKAACEQTLRAMQSTLMIRDPTYVPPKKWRLSPGYDVQPKRRSEPTDYGSMPSSPDYEQLPPDIVYEELPPTGGPRLTTNDISPLDVESREIVFETRAEVESIVAHAARIENGVSVGLSRTQAASNGVFSHRRWRAGDFVTKFDGEIVSYRRANTLLRTMQPQFVQTLRAGLWAVAGMDAYVDGGGEMDGRGAGSFIASTLQICDSIREGREIACDDAELNCELVLVTDADNSAASEEDFDPERSHLMVVATKDIAVGDELYLDTVRLGFFQ